MTTGLEEDDIVAALTDEVAVAVLPSVLYRSGQLLDLKRLTQEAHARGIIIGLILAIRLGLYPMSCMNGRWILPLVHL